MHSTCSYHDLDLRVTSMVYERDLTPVDNEESTQVPTPDTSQLPSRGLLGNTHGCGHHSPLKALPLMVNSDHGDSCHTEQTTRQHHLTIT